jgi:hypothetical protein
LGRKVSAEDFSDYFLSGSRSQARFANRTNSAEDSGRYNKRDVFVDIALQELAIEKIELT